MLYQVLFVNIQSLALVSLTTRISQLTVFPKRISSGLPYFL